MFGVKMSDEEKQEYLLECVAQALVALPAIATAYGRIAAAMERRNEIEAEKLLPFDKRPKGRI